VNPTRAATRESKAKTYLPKKSQHTRKTQSMKSLHIIAVAALASAGMAVTGHAQNFGNDGDLILGFRNGTSGHVLELDLGQGSAYTQSAHFNLTFGSYTGPSANSSPGLSVTDLSTVFGASWNTLSLNFGVAGGTGTGTSGIVWVTQTGSVAGSIPSGSIGTPLNVISAETSSFAGGLDTTNAQTFPVVSGDAMSADADVTSTSNYVGAVRPNGLSNDYNFFNGHPTEGVVSSTLSVNIPLYKYNAGAAPIEEGIFTLTPGGALTYNGVPEPSTITALMGGLGILGFLRRRRSSVA
jgi:hypothetical protein